MSFYCSFLKVHQKYKVYIYETEVIYLSAVLSEMNVLTFGVTVLLKPPRILWPVREQIGF